MKHVTYGEKSLLMDDDAAEALIDYAGAIADAGGGDTVRMQAVGDDGNEVEVVFLLNAGTVLIIESASADLPAPRNEDTVAEIERKSAALRQPPTAGPEAHDEPPALMDFDEVADQV
jgi:hypothetical protein